mgnify:CR=1 FL=1
MLGPVVLDDRLATHRCDRGRVAADGEARAHVLQLVGDAEKAGRIIEVVIGQEKRFVAVEDAARYRDALGVRLPSGLPAALLEMAPEPLIGLVSRYARTHGPFRVDEVARRLGMGMDPVRMALMVLLERGRLLEGEMLPGGSGLEFCDNEVLRILKRRSLSKWFADVEPVQPDTYARFLLEWQGVMEPRRGVQALLATVEQLQGTPMFVTTLENEILPARIEGYRMGDLDALCASGEIVWRGVERAADGVGKIALYLSAAYPYLAQPPACAAGAMAAKVRDVLERRGAVFFHDLLRETGGFAPEVVSALWELIWAGEVTNDTLAPLRSLGAEQRQDKRRPQRGRRMAPRRSILPGTEGRFSLLPKRFERGPTETDKRAALARSLLDRHGVLAREAVLAENISGGFSAVYDVLRAMEDAGKVRRGYFIAGLGAAQFALPGADDRLRALRDASDKGRVVVLSALDPASPWGAALRFPGDEHGENSRGGPRPKRALGARIVLRDGRLLAWLGRTEKHLLTFVQTNGAAGDDEKREIAAALARLVDEGRTRVVVIATIDGVPAARSPLSAALREIGFVETVHGYAKRRAFEPALPARLSGPRDGWARPWDAPGEVAKTPAIEPQLDDDFDDDDD